MIELEESMTELLFEHRETGAHLYNFINNNELLGLHLVFALTQTLPEKARHKERNSENTEKTYKKGSAHINKKVLHITQLSAKGIELLEWTMLRNELQVLHEKLVDVDRALGQHLADPSGIFRISKLRLYFFSRVSIDYFHQSLFQSIGISQFILNRFFQRTPPCL